MQAANVKTSIDCVVGAGIEVNIVFSADRSRNVFLLELSKVYKFKFCITWDSLWDSLCIG